MSKKVQPYAVPPLEAARLLSIGEAEMEQLLEREGFPCFKVAGITLISAEELRDWVRRQARGVSE